MKVDRISYAGWEECVRLRHQDITLVVTTKVGPRIIHCSLHDKENLFYLNPDQAGSHGGDEWKTYGGHRLWCSPEEKEFTYFPDNLPIEVKETIRGVQFTAPQEKSGVLKTITITPVEGRNAIKLDHIISNKGNKSLLLAPWALTVMRAGGTAVIPHNLDRPHQLLPTHSLALWGYTNPGDPRIIWGSRYIRVHQDPGAATPVKLGMQNPYGWAGYAVNGQFFLKRFAWDVSAQYPDFNCNFEVYANPDILELESLAPLVELAPGASVTHQEEWELFDHVPAPVTELDIEQHILPLA